MKHVCEKCGHVQISKKRVVMTHEHNGESRTVSEWSEITGIPVSAIRWRLQAGWSIEKALTEPSDTSNKPTLTPKQRKAIITAYVNGEKQSDLARKFKTTKANVHSMVKRAGVHRPRH